MTENDLLDAVTNIGADVVQRFVAMDQRLAEKKKPTLRKTLLAAAACFLIIAGGAVLLPRLPAELGDAPKAIRDLLRSCRRRSRGGGNAGRKRSLRKCSSQGFLLCAQNQHGTSKRHSRRANSHSERENLLRTVQPYLRNRPCRLGVL